MSLSIQTLQCIFVALSISLAILLSILADKSGKDGLTIWAIGLCLNAVAFIFWGLKIFSFGTLHIPVPEATISLSYAVFALYLYRLLEERFPHWLMVTPPVVTFLGCLLFRHTHIYLSVFVNMVMFLQVFVISTKLVLNSHRLPFIGRSLVLCGISLVLCIDLLRIWIALHLSPDHDHAALFHQIATATFLLSFCSMAVTGTGVIFMSKGVMRIRALAQQSPAVSRRALSDKL